MERASFLDSILESTTEYSIVAEDLAGVILVWNDGARRTYGYEPTEVVGIKSAFILHHGDDVTSGRAQGIRDDVRQNGRWCGELRRVRKDGSGFRAFVTMTLRRDAAGDPVGFTMLSHDLTALRELRASQEYNRGLVESNIDALLTTDTLGLITDVNRQMCEMTGASREALIGSPFKRYFTDPQLADEGIRKVLAEDRITNRELVMRSATGKTTVVSYNATTRRTLDGKLEGVFASMRDITEQKRLEDDLRQVQNYTRGLIEASGDALLTVDPELWITDVNEQTVRMTGYSREELIGSPFPDYFTDPERASAGVAKTLAEAFVTNYELRLLAKTGTETLVSFNASVFKDTSGATRGIFVSARDITEQKRLEEQLRQAQNYTRGLIEASIDPMITVDAELTITDVNEQMVQLTEVDKNVLIGSRFDKYFTEPDRAAAGVRETLREGSVTNYELTLRTSSARQVLVSFNASIFKDTEGKVKGIFAVARDITEQRRLEHQLLEQQNYRRDLIEASVDALVTIDPQGRITDVNQQMVRHTGRNKQELLGTQFADHFTDPDRARSGVQKTFDESVVKNYDLVVRPKSGSDLSVSFNASAFRDASGRVAGIFAAARDVSDQKQLQQKLVEQQVYTRGMIESNIDALMTTDVLGVITDVNKQMCAVTGRDRESLVGTPFKDYFTDPKRAEDGIRTVLADGRVTNYELTIRAGDGKETLVSYNAATFTDEDGKLRGVFAAARDITDQKRLEEQLRQVQNYSRGLIESSIDAMFTVDPDNTITEANGQMVKLSGYSREHLVGSSFLDYFVEPERAAGGVQKTLSDGFVTNYELVLRSRHRRQILVSFNASVFKDTAGQVRGIFAVARDITEQRRLEEKLRESENYNRGLIESSVDALVTVNPDLGITDVNEEMVRLTGYSREELVGSSFKDYFTEPARATAGVRQALDEGAVTNYELVLKSRTGRRTVVSFYAGTFKDTAGRIAGIVGAARDITAQKRLEDQLREEQSYNRSLFEASVDALMTVDPLGIITDVNEQTTRLTGYNRKQLEGSLFVDYFTDAERATAGVKKTFDDGRVTEYELILKSKSGKKSPVSFNAAVFRDTTGRVAGILASARDITQQKTVDQALRDHQTYTRGLIESNIDALMTTDTLGIITDVNKQMCAVTGCTHQELIGTAFKDYFTDPKRAEDGIRKVLADDRVTNYELTIRNRDGGEMIVSYNATTFRGADGKLRGVFAAARDITDQKRLEEQLRRKNDELEEQNHRVQKANRLKSEFLANMSHELRTPLNGIIGLAELMHDGKVGAVSSDHKEYLGDILMSSGHLLQLINDVLDLAKVESGKTELRPEPVELEKLINDVRDIVRTLIAEKRIRLVCEVDANVENIIADPAKLKQVLYNFLSNALKFTPEDGSVTVRVLPEGPDHFRLEVADSGIGIRAEDFDRLFVEFQQLDASAAKKFQGTGLGLALTRRIVEAQGGHVGVTSTLGKGSTFSAVLPRVAKTIDAKTESLPRPAGAAILVVEDDAKDRAWLVRTLSAAGYSVEAVASGQAATRAARTRAFDCVTLDLLLPDMGGWDVLRGIRETSLNAHVPAVVVTVMASEGSGVGSGIQEFLVKPVSPSDLLDALARIGLPPGSERSLLIIDDDASASRRVAPALDAVDYKLTTMLDGESGLAAARAHPPSAILLDLMMPGMDGFEFLHRFRLTPKGRSTPVIVWSAKDLTSEERAQLQASANAIIHKGAGAADRLLAEVARCVPRPRSADAE